VRRVRHHPWAPASIWLGGDRVPSRAIARAEAMLADRADYARYTHGFGYVQAADWCALGSCPRARTATVIAVLLAVDVLMQWAYAWSAPERTIRVFALAVAVIWALRSVHRGRFIAPTSSRHHDTRSPCAAPPTGPGHGCGRRPGPPRGRRALPESGMNGRKNLRLTAVRASRNGRAGCRRPVEHTTPAAPDRYAGGGPQ